ncbi:MAG: cupin domain-containing protein [Pseudomonadota bacterium]
MQFHDFDIDAFLRDAWQKQPRLIRNPWRNWVNPIEPDELAGLACDDEIESRLIVCAGDTWSLEHGPLSEARFAELGDGTWTLLVQAVDHAVPAVAELIAPFRFVPNWRIDDVMVSYASDGGGVGPHFDQYDVFLVQGLGRRRWRVGPRCDAATPLRPHDALRLIEDFAPVQEWVLEPGDILYVPPGFAHDGVAIGSDCMTYSIGFRAPSRAELIEDWCEDVVDRLDEDDRYVDRGRTRQDNCGEIAAADVDRLHAMVTERMLDRDAFARWFGRHASTRKYPDLDWQPDAPLSVSRARAVIAAEAVLRRNPASRFAFIRKGDGTLLLFADGSEFPCQGADARFAERLCAEEALPLGGDAVTADLLVRLYNQGSVTIER